ncbi:MAG TPA: substrate-binding domain-containing protein, partial [Chitinophagaceae bacterium]|nr:substrate-binding domain-containing protein [Chitinophagaceae bacterium]
PDLLDQFYVLAINGVEKIAEKEKYNVIVSQSHEEVDKEEKITNLMISNRVDGVIVAITKNTVNMQLFEKLNSIGIPVVCISRKPADDSFNYVLSNNKEGALKATEFLVKKKHRRIAHIMGPPHMQTCKDRFEGYTLALQKHKIPFDAELVKTVDFTKESTTKAMKELIKLKSPPTAIFTFKNYITIDGIEFLKNKHPGKLNKIDFVGFGNLPLLQYMDHKPVAVIDENSFEMGTKAAELLFRIIKQEDADPGITPQHIQTPCKLIVY